MQTIVNNEPAFVTATIKTIYERRAVRKYHAKQVPVNLIETVIDAGRMAPSAMNKQPWKFYVFTDKETIQSLSKEIKKAAARDIIKKGVKQIIKTAAALFHTTSGIDFSKAADPVFYGAPAVIFITAPEDNEWGCLDVGMCVQNMLLAAKSLGLDSCPVGFAKYLQHTKAYSLLPAKPGEQIHIAVIMGYGAESPEAHKRIKNNVLFVE